MTTTKSRPESHFIEAHSDSHSLRLHYLDWGNPHAGAPVIVCVHGFAMSAHSFNGFARRFRDRFHILSMDTRGHGDSGHAPAHAYTDEHNVDDLEAFIDALDLSRVILVGSSLGGRYSMMYADRHPERVDRIVVNDIGPVARPNANKRPADGLKRPREFEKPEDALPYLVQAIPPHGNLPFDEQVEQVRGLLRQREDGIWVWKMDTAPIRERRAGTTPPRPPVDLWPVVKRLQCPVLIVWGMKSHLLDEALARETVAALPDGEFVAVPDVGHVPWLTEPTAAEALERFLGASPLLTHSDP